jgi:hypothetical protein
MAQVPHVRARRTRIGRGSVESRAVVWIYLLLRVLIVILAMIATLFYLARPTEQDRHPLS